MSDEREPIIDALLEELLGEQQPPDLTQRILGAHDAATDSTVDVRRFTQGKTARTPSAVTEESGTNGKHKLDPHPVVSSRSKAQPNRRNTNLQTWASVAVILIGATGFFGWYLWSGDDFNYTVINVPTDSPSQTTPSDPARTAPFVADTSNSIDNEDHNQEDYFPNAPQIDLEVVNVVGTLDFRLAIDQRSGGSTYDPKIKDVRMGEDLNKVISGVPSYNDVTVRLKLNTYIAR